MLYPSTRYYKACSKWNRKLVHKVKKNGKEIKCIVSKEKVENGFSIITLKTENGHYKYKRLIGKNGPYYGPLKLFIYSHNGEFLETFSWVMKNPFVGQEIIITTNNTNTQSNNSNQTNTNNSNLLESTDDDYNMENESQHNESSNNNSNNTNNKNKKNKNNNYNKNSLVKARNRFSKAPPTVSFYAYEEKEHIIETKWIPIFVKKEKDMTVSKKLRNSITRALQDLADAKSPFEKIRTETYNTISNLFMTILTSDDINETNEHKVRKHTCTFKTKNHENNNNNNKKNNNSNNSNNNKNNNSNSNMSNENVKDYCYVCNVNIPTIRETKLNKNNKSITIEKESILKHWTFKIFHEKDEKHVNGDKFCCLVCGDTFPNAVMLSSHNLYTHTQQRRKDTVTEITCGHKHHSMECNPITCRKPGSNGCVCNKESICESKMYAAWVGQARMYKKMCVDKRCRHLLVPPKCDDNPKNRKDCICGNEKLCDWAKINYSVKSDQEFKQEYTKKSNELQSSDGNISDTNIPNKTNNNNNNNDKMEVSDEEDYTEVKEWLHNIGMQRYFDKFKQNGFSSLEYVKLLKNNDDELNELHIKQAHKLKIASEIQKL